MNKSLKYSILVISLIIILLSVYSFYLLANSGIPLDKLKDRIINSETLISNLNIDDISGIKLNYDNEKGIFLKISNITLKSNSYLNTVNLENSLIDFAITNVLFSKLEALIETDIHFLNDNVYKLAFKIKVNEKDKSILVSKFLGPDLYLVSPSRLLIKNNKVEFEDSLDLRMNLKSLNKNFNSILSIQLPKISEVFESWTHVIFSGELDLNKGYYQENMIINLSGITDFNFLIPELENILGVVAVDMKLSFLENNNLVSFNLFTNGNLDLKSSQIQFSKDFNSSNFKLKINATSTLSSLLQTIDYDFEKQFFDSFKRVVKNNPINLDSFDFNFKASNYFKKSFIESISDIKLSLAGNLDANFISTSNENPTKLVGLSKIKVDMFLDNLSFSKFRSSGSLILDELDIFYRPFNFSKPKSKKLEIFFDSELSESLKVKLFSNDNLFVRGDIEVTNDKKVIVSELLLNNSENMNLSLSGNIHKRIFNGKVSGELIDFTALKDERKKKDKFFFDRENYDLEAKTVILQGPVEVNNFTMTINKEREKFRAKGKADSNGHSLYYLRTKDKKTDISLIKSTDIISFIGSNHPFKKILSKGDVNIKSTRDSYSVKSLNKIELNEFTLINTPAALKLLTLPSLSGISSLIENEDGINFLNGNVTYIEEPDSYSNIRMFGVSDSIGLVMDGDIDRKNEMLNFDGEISPIHLVNMLLKKIPIIGDLLIGKEGEGLFAFEFEMSGNSSDPEVSSNPLSIAKPQILERASDYLKTIE